MTIRILHVIGAMDRAGAETMLMNLHRSIDRKQFQFDYLVHEQRQCDYDEEIEDLGGKIYRLPRFYGINYLDYLKKCNALFKSDNIHPIVHGHIGSSAPIYLSTAKKTGKFTIAHSHAQNFLPGIWGLGFNAVARPVRSVADYFMACSEEAGLDRFGESIVQSKRFSVIKNGINLSNYLSTSEEISTLKKENKLTDKVVFGHVGRFAEEKNHSFLIEVFAEIHKNLPNAVLLLAGRGPLEEKVKEQVNQLGLASSVTFLGICNDVPNLLKSLDCFLLPSKKEGLGIAAIEAQATGLPCLVSEGVPSLAIITKNTQQLPLDSKLWAKTCIDYFENNEKLQMSRQESFDAVKKAGFDINETVNWLQDFYQKHV